MSGESQASIITDHKQPVHVPNPIIHRISETDFRPFTREEVLPLLDQLPEQLLVSKAVWTPVEVEALKLVAKHFPDVTKGYETMLNVS